MNKEKLINLFVDAIKKSDIALKYQIEVIETSTDEEIANNEFYFELGYQIDDRIERTDKSVEEKIQSILGDKYGVSLARKDAFPNGMAYYELTIDR